MLSANFKPKRTAAASRGFLATARLSCYLNQQLGTLLVDLAHQLSFYLDSPVLSVKNSLLIGF